MTATAYFAPYPSNPAFPHPCAGCSSCQSLAWVSATCARSSSARRAFHFPTVLSACRLRFSARASIRSTCARFRASGLARDFTMVLPPLPSLLEHSCSPLRFAVATGAIKECLMVRNPASLPCGLALALLRSIGGRFKRGSMHSNPPQPSSGKFWLVFSTESTELTGRTSCYSSWSS